jgi:uncharacterized membrane protein
LRKFASLLFSILYFGHPFKILHWLGTIFLIVGTIMFTEIVGRIKESLKKSISNESRGNDDDIEQSVEEQKRDMSFYRKMLKKSTQKIKSISIPRPHISYKVLENTQ